MGEWERGGLGDWESGSREDAKTQRKRGMRKVGMKEEEGEGGGKMRGRKYGMAMCPGGG